MVYVKYWLQTIIDLFAKYFIAWPLTPILILLATKDNKLPAWLSWFDTFDNTLDGDNGWKTKTRPYLIEANSYQRYINRCRWLWRNSFYGFSKQVCGIKYEVLRDSMLIEGHPGISNGPPGKSGLVKRYLYRNGKLMAFQWYYIRQYKRWPKKCIRINLGWKLWSWSGIGADSAMHVFSPSPWMHFDE